MRSDRRWFLRGLAGVPLLLPSWDRLPRWMVRNLSGPPVRKRVRGHDAAAGFTPADLPDIVDWATGADLVQDDPAPGEGINQWTGREGGTVIVRQTTGSKKPEHLAAETPGGNAAAKFDGGDSLRSDLSGGAFPASPLSHPFTIWFLFRIDVETTCTVLGSAAGGANRVQVIEYVSTDQWQLFAGAGSAAAATIDSGVWYRARALFKTTASDLSLDEASVWSGNSGSNAISGFVLGERFDPGVQPAQITVGGWAIQDDEPTAQEDTDMWAWLGGL